MFDAKTLALVTHAQETWQRASSEDRSVALKHLEQVREGTRKREACHGSLATMMFYVADRVQTAHDWEA